MHAQWIQVTIDIQGGRWQVSSDGSATLFNKSGNIAWDGYIGGKHSLYTPGNNSFTYPTGLGRIVGNKTRTAPTGGTLPPGCAYAEMFGQDFDADYDTESQMLRSGRICWDEDSDLPEKDLPDDGSGDSSSPPGYVSPILIDLDHDGFQLTGLNDAVLFDLDADGAPKRTSWTAAGVADSFLVLDRNGNGVIDDGQELFGNATRLLSGHMALNGYLALRELDANGDEAIDASDAIWPSLQVWTDRNHDAVSQSSELQSLEEVGIDLLDTRYSESQRRDRYGNLFRFNARALVADKQSKTYDVFFMQDMR